MSRHGLVVMAYGTPAAPDQVEAYYTHIRRGRPPTTEQLADLARRYEAIGGLSPLATRTADQVAAVAAALDAREPGRWAVALGNKHAAPFVEDAVAHLAAGGVDRLVGLVLAPHFSQGSVAQYHERAGSAAASAGLPYAGIDAWHDEPAWLDAQVARVRAALAGLPAATEVVFTAHSLPERIREWGDPYEGELLDSSGLVAERLALPDWRFAWQSAGGTG
ncbi:MAG TPA: ferrochelatase, partial [Acidimicrobiales bacterium]